MFDIRESRTRACIFSGRWLTFGRLWRREVEEADHGCEEAEECDEEEGGVLVHGVLARLSLDPAVASGDDDDVDGEFVDGVAEAFFGAVAW